MFRTPVAVNAVSRDAYVNAAQCKASDEQLDALGTSIFLQAQQLYGKDTIKVLNDLRTNYQLLQLTLKLNYMICVTDNGDMPSPAFVYHVHAELQRRLAKLVGGDRCDIKIYIHFQSKTQADKYFAANPALGPLCAPLDVLHKTARWKSIRKQLDQVIAGHRVEWLEALEVDTAARELRQISKNPPGKYDRDEAVAYLQDVTADYLCSFGETNVANVTHKHRAPDCSDQMGVLLSDHHRDYSLDVWKFAAKHASKFLLKETCCLDRKSFLMHKIAVPRKDDSAELGVVDVEMQASQPSLSVGRSQPIAINSSVFNGSVSADYDSDSSSGSPSRISSSSDTESSGEKQQGRSSREVLDALKSQSLSVVKGSKPVSVSSPHSRSNSGSSTDSSSDSPRSVVCAASATSDHADSKGQEQFVMIKDRVLDRKLYNQIITDFAMIVGSETDEDKLPEMLHIAVKTIFKMVHERTDVVVNAIPRGGNDSRANYGNDPAASTTGSAVEQRVRR